MKSVLKLATYPIYKYNPIEFNILLPSIKCSNIFSNTDKYIVCKDELMALFKMCPACREETAPEIVRSQGTLIVIEQVGVYSLNYIFLHGLNYFTTSQLPNIM